MDGPQKFLVVVMAIVTLLLAGLLSQARRDLDSLTVNVSNLQHEIENAQ